MDDGLKQRLVGAAVLVAVAVLFIPVLFERESRLVVDHTSQIPPPLLVEPVTVELPQDNPEIPPVQSAESMYELLPEDPVGQSVVKDNTAAPVQTAVATPTAKPAVAGTEASSPAREVLDERGIPKAWAIQVASFNTQARANAMRDQLLAKDYPAFTRSAETSQGTLTRVFVGPKISRDQAYSLKSKLDSELKTETLVVTFLP